MSTNYSEQIFQAVDTIVSQRLEDQGSDKTIVCTIVQTYPKDPTKFMVSNGSVKFELYYAGQEELVLNSQVYVLIPNGDFSSPNKQIIGLYKSSVEQKQYYKKPFNRFVPHSKFVLLPDEQGKIEITDLDFDTVPSSYGSFQYMGVRLYITNDDEQRNPYTISITLGDVVINIPHTEIYGNPYKLNSFIPIEFLYEIKDSEYSFDSIQANIISDKAISAKIDKIEIQFGFALDLPYIENNLIISTNITNYPGSNLDNYVALEFYQNNEIYSQYNPFNNSVFWERFNAEKQQWESIDEIGGYYENISNYLYSNNSTTLIRAKISTNIETGDELQLKTFESNVLVFKNNAYDANEEGINVESQDLTFILNASDNGVYNYYGMDNQATSPAWSVPKDISVIIKNGAIPWTELNVGSVTWSIPATGTMIEPADKKDWNLNNQFYTLTGDISLSSIKYKLKQTYDPSRINNYIYCTVTDPTSSITYTGKAKFAIGSLGNNGLLYAFNLIPDINFISNQSYDNEVAITASLEDSKGNIIDLESKNSDGQYLFPIEWKVIQNHQEKTVELNTSENTNSQMLLKISDTPKDLIIQASISLEVKSTEEGKVSRTKTIEAYLVIPVLNITKDDIKESIYLTGPTRICYGSTIGSIYYDKNTPYSLIGCNKEIEYWKIQRYNGSTLEEVSYNNSFTINNEGYLTAPGTINEEHNIILIGYDENNSPVIYYPLLIFKGIPISNFINAWDEILIFDNETATIGANSIIAGSKNANNEFTGVITGELKIKDEYGSIDTNSGIFGYNNNALVFELNKNGQFFVGNDKNKLNFEEKTGLTLTFSDPNNGLVIDGGKLLVQGTVAIKNEDGTINSSYTHKSLQLKNNILLLNAPIIANTVDFLATNIQSVFESNAGYFFWYTNEWHDSTQEQLAQAHLSFYHPYYGSGNKRYLDIIYYYDSEESFGNRNQITIAAFPDAEGSLSQGIGFISGRWFGEVEGYHNSMQLNYIKKQESTSGHYIEMVDWESQAWGITVWASDQKLKYDIKNSSVYALPIINKIQHREFKWKKNSYQEKLGYIAQEIEQIIPQAVITLQNGDKTTTKQLAESAFIPYITKSIQELYLIIQKLENEIKELKQI